MSHKGGCHCGRVAFEVDADIATAIECNCSICSKKGHLLAFVPASNVVLRTPESALSTYTFNTHRIRHQFCPVCGIAPFGRGTDREGNETFAVNVRCLEGVDLRSLEIQSFDGRSL
ncbi:GFA family protein [Dokdonella sp.]|uniref:GFA family protein n=1 Tax=Dokdonella sp. TaxID=2291710 RepID=UPI002F41599C